MARYEIGMRNKVRRCYRAIAESEVGAGISSRFFGVVIEVCLYIFRSRLSDNFNGVLVCSYSSVGSETIEFTFGDTLFG